jgi:hypothetical protein
MKTQQWKSAFSANWGQQTSHYMFFNEWNNLPPFVKDSSSFLAFKNKYVSVCNE